MKIHEYQAKQIFREAGVAVPRSLVADTPKAASEAFSSLGVNRAVVKGKSTPAGAARGQSPTCPANMASSWSATATRRKMSPPTCWATDWQPSRLAPKARRSITCWSKKAARSRGSSMSGCWSIGLPAGRCWSPRRKAALRSNT